MRLLLPFIVLAASSAHAESPPQLQAEAPAEAGAGDVLVGARFGAEIDGPLGQSAGVLEVELGVLLHERVAVVLGAGFAWCDRDDHLQRLPAAEGLGPGHVMVDRGFAPRLTLEARYRQPLVSGALPLWLEVAAGVMASRELHSAVGPAFFSEDLGCDPTEGACPLVLGSADVEVDPTAAFRVGLDLRFGPAFIGYRAQIPVDEASTSHVMYLGSMY